MTPARRDDDASSHPYARRVAHSDDPRASGGQPTGGRPGAGRATSRAREGGTARPVRGGAAPVPTTDQQPPSFAPRSGATRPTRDGAPPVVVGRPPAPRTPPRSSTPQPAPGRPAPSAARQATTPARPPGTASRPATIAPAVRPAAAQPATARPAVRPPTARPAAAPVRPSRRRVTPARVGLGLLLVLALLASWPVGLAVWANGRLERVAALSGAAATPGTTYLLTGADSRADGGTVPDDGTVGSRTDTIMVLHVPGSGPAALISLPRDTYVDVPGHGPTKLNAAYALGGPPLLVSTVEQLTGLGVDHYVEVGFAGVEGVVDAVGGVELCLDYDVYDELSGLDWTAGCAVADGPTALSFARMRYSDPLGDIGRTQRQQQLIGAITAAVAQPSLLVSPGRQVSLLRAGTDALLVSEGTSAVDLARLALGFRAASGPDGITGTPPIANPDYRPGGLGSTVLLDPEAAPTFWQSIIDGTLPPGPVGGLPLG